MFVAAHILQGSSCVYELRARAMREVGQQRVHHALASQQNFRLVGPGVDRLRAQVANYKKRVLYNLRICVVQRARDELEPVSFMPDKGAKVYGVLAIDCVNELRETPDGRRTLGLGHVELQLVEESGQLPQRGYFCHATSIPGVRVEESRVTSCGEYRITWARARSGDCRRAARVHSKSIDTARAEETGGVTLGLYPSAKCNSPCKLPRRGARSSS